MIPASSRRRFIGAGAVSIGIPALLSNSTPAAPLSGKLASLRRPRRMVLIGVPFGFHAPNLFPSETGAYTEPPLYLSKLSPQQRSLMSVISGLENRGVGGAHQAYVSLFTGAEKPGSSGFRNSISVDQLAAEQIGYHTRFDSIAISYHNQGLSFTRAGIALPAEHRPSQLFSKLFLTGTKKSRDTQLRRIAQGQSILDVVGSQLNVLSKRSGQRDIETIEQYENSIRELEIRLAKEAEWFDRPKPKVDHKPPQPIEDTGRFDLWFEQMYDLIVLALQTDSTRLMTLSGFNGAGPVTLPGVKQGWHTLSHHGRDPDKLRQLALIEQTELGLFAKFVERLSQTPDGDGMLLDSTVVALASSLGNASSHSNKNLPVILAGGPFKHGLHYAFDPNGPPPLCNLYVSFLQFLGIETNHFSSGTSTLRGFEV